MRAREIMTKDPKTVTPDDTLSRAASIMRDMDVGIVPVVDSAGGKNLQGVITDRDIAVRHVAERHTGDCPVSEHMSSDVTTVGPDDDARDVMARMQRAQVRRMPVVDGDDLVGIVAQADIAVEVGPREPEEVEETVEQISTPAQPQR